MEENEDYFISGLGLLFTLIFGGMAIIVIAFFLRGSLEGIDWTEYFGWCLLVFIGFVVAISTNILFFSILDFILISFILVTTMEAGFFAILVVWFFSILLICFYSTLGYGDNFAFSPKFKEKIRYIPEGYKKIHFDSKRAWVKFLGGITIEEEREKIHKLNIQIQELSQRYDNLLELYKKKLQAFDERS